MKKEITDLVLILDRSSSMYHLQEATINGFNDMINKQKVVEGDCRVTTVLFNHDVRTIYHHQPIQTVQNMTSKDYWVDGSTALLDAIGFTIQKMIKFQREAKESSRADKFIFVIMTDGQENSSVEFDYFQINNMINHQKSIFNWEFIFLGANIDAAEVSEKIGIDKSRAQNFHADKKGMSLNYETMSDVVKNYRNHSRINDDWKDRIDSDYKSRSKK